MLTEVRPRSTAESIQEGNRPGATVWLTGLPSAGKTTLAHAVAGRLRAGGRRVEVLDGDAVRETLSAGLGFSRADRDANVERIGFVADLLARNGVVVLAAVISPYAETRQRVRRRHLTSGTPFVEVHVATPLDECATRDVKGLYARARSGQIRGLTGVDDPYETPTDPDVRLDTAGRSVDDCARTLLATLAGRGLVGPADAEPDGGRPARDGTARDGTAGGPQGETA